jgi:hypothetical protein
MNQKTRDFFNGASPHLWDALKMLIVSGLVGGLLVWKNAAVLEVKFDHICGEVSRIEKLVDKLSDKIDSHLVGDKK